MAAAKGKEAAAAKAARDAKEAEEQAYWVPDALCDEFLDFIPYHKSALETANKKGDTNAVAKELRARKWLPPVGEKMAMSSMVKQADLEKWAAIKNHNKDVAKNLVVAFVRHIVMKVSSGNNVIKSSDLNAFVAQTAFNKLPHRPVLLDAAVQLQQVWGYQVVPSVSMSVEDEGPSFEDTSDYIVRLDIRAKSGAAESESQLAQRCNMHKHLTDLANSASTSEMERRGVLMSLLGAISATKRQFLTEHAIYSYLASTNDASFIKQERDYEQSKAGGGAGAGSKRKAGGMEGYDAVDDFPGGLPLKELLKEFIAQKWLVMQEVNAEDAQGAEAGPSAAGAGAVAAEGSVTVYRAGPRARMTVGPLGAMRWVKAVTEDHAPVQKDRVAVAMPDELGVFVHRVPAGGYEMHAKDDDLEDGKTSIPATGENTFSWAHFYPGRRRSNRN